MTGAVGSQPKRNDERPDRSWVGPRRHGYKGALELWALRGITERLLEAADRELWAEPFPETLDRLKQAYLQLEGDLESGE